MDYAIGIDVGGTTIKVGLVGTDAHIHHHFSVDTPRSADELVTLMPSIIERIHTDLTSGVAPHISPDDIIPTIGIDVPGIVNDRTGIAEFSANIGWRNFNAHEQFQTALTRPVAFGHDVRNGALAESYWGVALPHFFYIAIGTGVASVLIVDNQPVSPHSWAGEIGQIPTSDPDTPTTLRAMEQIASASAIARRAHEHALIAHDLGANEVYRIADGTLSVSDAGGTSPLTSEQARKVAQRIIDDAITTLARTIAPALAAFGPIPVVIGGGLANEGAPLQAHLSRALSDALGIIPTPTVKLAQLGARSQVLGAALRAFLTEGITPTPQEHP